jgi:hypothetical protein
VDYFCVLLFPHPYSLEKRVDPTHALASVPCATCGTIGNRDEHGECVFCNDALIADLDHVLTTSPRSMGGQQQKPFQQPHHSSESNASLSPQQQSSPRHNKSLQKQDSGASATGAGERAAVTTTTGGGDPRRAHFGVGISSSGGVSMSHHFTPRKQPSRVQMAQTNQGYEGFE